MRQDRADRLEITGPIRNKRRIIGRKGLSFAGFRSITSIVDGKVHLQHLFLAFDVHGMLWEMSLAELQSSHETRQT